MIDVDEAYNMCRGCVKGKFFMPFDYMWDSMGDYAHLQCVRDWWLHDGESFYPIAPDDCPRLLEFMVLSDDR